jgi:hypothetical protein
MRRLQPKIASRIAAGLAADGPCPEHFVLLLERLARLQATIEADWPTDHHKDDGAASPDTGKPVQGSPAGSRRR